jgi:DNA-binding PadR family transcriptional regulator
MQFTCHTEQHHGCGGSGRFEYTSSGPTWYRHAAHRFGMERDMDMGPWGRGGGRRRMFDGGELRLVLLKLISDQPSHGYDLIRAIEERTGGAYSPSPGVVYPTITLLADMGLIGEQDVAGARKSFAITPDGTTHLEERAEEVEAIFARLDALRAVRERTGAAPIRRAMHNLRSVLDHRLAEGLDKELMHAAVALIDEAAGKIERL